MTPLIDTTMAESPVNELPEICRCDAAALRKLDPKIVEGGVGRQQLLFLLLCLVTLFAVVFDRQQYVQ